MATDQKEEVIVDVEEVYSKTEQYVEENKNTLTIIVGAIVLIIGGYFSYMNLYLAPMEVEAKEQMWKAEQYFEMDSFRLAINGDGQYLGFMDILDSYGATKSGNLSNYYLGISYLRLGEYQTAIDYLSDFSSNDKMIAPTATGAIGDAYMELGNTDKAFDYYKKAADQNDNDFTAPIFLMKAGFAAEQLQKNAEAIEIYKKLKKKYPKSSESKDADKYIARLGEY